ncbi:MAG TPA: hypothetical protein VJN01_13260, partial [Xanthomonadales bacterium]|nr:hypothetical protein [Xanthomonadales bacterium]
MNLIATWLFNRSFSRFSDSPDSPAKHQGLPMTSPDHQSASVPTTVAAAIARFVRSQRVSRVYTLPGSH